MFHSPEAQGGRGGGRGGALGALQRADVQRLRAAPPQGVRWQGGAHAAQPWRAIGDRWGASQLDGLELELEQTEYTHTERNTEHIDIAFETLANSISIGQHWFCRQINIKNRTCEEEA